jgi:hypothetical protein
LSLPLRRPATLAGTFRGANLDSIFQYEFRATDLAKDIKGTLAK